MKFNVFTYMKGTSNRGYILGAVDDILQCLDDSSMNLQVCCNICFIFTLFPQVHYFYTCTVSDGNY